MIDDGMQLKQEVSKEKEALFRRCLGLGDDVMGWEAVSWVQSGEVPWRLRNCHSGRVCT